MVRAYRVYFTTFYEEESRAVTEKLRALLGREPIEHHSKVPGFKFLEFRGDDLREGLEGEIKRAVLEALGPDAYVRVDYINL